MQLQTDHSGQTTTSLQELRKKLDELSEELRTTKAQNSTPILEETLNLQRQTLTQDAEIQNQLRKLAQAQAEYSAQNAAAQHDTTSKLYALYEELRKMQTQTSTAKLAETIKTMQTTSLARDTDLRKEVRELKQQQLEHDTLQRDNLTTNHPPRRNIRNDSAN